MSTDFEFAFATRDTPNGEWVEQDVVDSFAAVQIKIDQLPKLPYEVQVDVLCWSEEGALAYGGDDALESYREDPDCSVLERSIWRRKRVLSIPVMDWDSPKNIVGRIA